MVLVVDGGIVMVVGSTVGVVLVLGGDYGGRCDGDRGGGYSIAKGGKTWGGGGVRRMTLWRGVTRRRGDSRLSVQGEPLIVLTREP